MCRLALDHYYKQCYIISPLQANLAFPHFSRHLYSRHTTLNFSTQISTVVLFVERLGLMSSCWWEGITFGLKLDGQFLITFRFTSDISRCNFCQKKLLREKKISLSFLFFHTLVIKTVQEYEGWDKRDALHSLWTFAWSSHIIQSCSSAL